MLPSLNIVGLNIVGFKLDKVVVSRIEYRSLSELRNVG